MTGAVALKAAYSVTIVVQLVYVWYLTSRYFRVRREMRDLERSK